MIIHKVFWAWDDYKEEAWLRQMAQSGWHLVQVKMFTYIFVAGEPRDYAYRLDFMPMDRGKDEYFQLFHDAGWEHVDKFIGWEYWRKEVKPGQEAEIFTDPDSKSRKYRLLLRFELTVGLLLIGDILYSFGIALRYRNEAYFPSVCAPLGILLLLVPVLAYIILRLWKRIRQLRQL